MGPAFTPAPTILDLASRAPRLESFFFFYRMAIVMAFLVLVIMVILVCTRRCRLKTVLALLLTLGNTRDRVRARPQIVCIG